MGYFSMPFDRLRKDELGWTTGFTLLGAFSFLFFGAVLLIQHCSDVDTIETYFDSRIDLLERHLKKQGDKLKIRAEEALKRTKTPMGEFRYSVDLEKELQKFKLKVSSRMTNLAVTWQSTKVVRTREKISFFIGVNAVAFSALMFSIAPEWVHVAYTIGALSLIPIRWYTYKQKAWHYFLFDLSLVELPHLNAAKALLISGVIYIVWQTLYWKFVLIDRRQKIQSGLRTTSFSWLLNDKHGAIGRALSSVKPAYREPSFMAGQLGNIWNGGGFYIEVFGRKFERELEALRKELAEATASSRPGTSISIHSAPAGQSTNTYSGRTSPTHSEEFYATGSAAPSQDGSPMVHGIDLYTDESPQPMSLAIDEETDVSNGIHSDDKKQV
ncbi:hypothetical protein Clacol_005967 [Clathrus columnatus]|uniref:Glycerophosphocholine acyltransferase 1 n=1 Tax=Clathrus columnatus TaxID=1419009 RepID=A0AAV5AAT8_9AGAM|nr:hypothetical protein Clacol_005967 [Clathrus columnatus]